MTSLLRCRRSATDRATPGDADAGGRACFRPATGPRRAGLVALVGLLVVGSGCAAAAGAALAANEIRQGIAGVQQLVAGARSLQEEEVGVARELRSPLAGTYRGFQALGDDTVDYYVRTAERPAAPILDEAGGVTGYVLPGIAAVTLDTLESRVGARDRLDSDDLQGRVMFFVEGTQAPDLNARTLYPAAFLGRPVSRESTELDRQDSELRRRDIDLEAPEFDDLSGQGIRHELFGSVAEGIFTLRPGGDAEYHQELEVDEARTLTLHFERISATTLPAVR
jgi:hypothetical protein